MTLRERQHELDGLLADGEARRLLAHSHRVRVDAADRDVIARRGTARAQLSGRARRRFLPGQRRDRLRVRLGDALDRAEQLEVLGPDVRDDDDPRTIPRRSAIWPRPRIPISVIRISVSGSSRQTVSGSPISLFKALLCPDRPCGAHSAEDVLGRRLPAEPTTATTARRSSSGRATRARASAASWSRGTSVAAPRARASSTNSTPVLSATKRSPGPTSRESALIAVISPPPSRSPSWSPAISSHASGIMRLQQLSGDLAVVERRDDSADVLPCSWPLPAITTMSPSSASATARAIAASIRVDLDVEARPGARPG